MRTNQQTQQGYGQGMAEARARFWQLPGPWWMLLLTGLVWLVIAAIVLRFTTASAATIGILLGVVFLGAMLSEFLIAGVRRR